MDLLGDFPVPGLKFDATAYVDNFGQISTEVTKNRVNRVTQVIDGFLNDVLHLIGHNIQSINHFLTNGILRSTKEVNAFIKELPQREPGSYLIQVHESLYGVIIDSKGQTRIAGLVRHVISEQFEGYRKAVKIANDNTWDFCDPEDLDIEALISNGAILGIVGVGGFFFLQTNICDMNELPDLALILQNGYFIIEKSKLVWIRLIGKIESNVTELDIGEFFTSNCGGCIRGSDSDCFELYGTGSAIVNFARFKEFATRMQITEFEQLSERQESNAEELEVIENQLKDDSEELWDTFSDMFCPSEQSPSRNIFNSLKDPDLAAISDEEYFDEDYDY